MAVTCTSRGGRLIVRRTGSRRRMRTVDVSLIAEHVRQAVQTVNVHTPEPVMIRLNDILLSEPSPAGRLAMRDIVENRQVASANAMPMCQDTGMVVVFVKLGQEVQLTGGDLRDAINEGVRRGYAEGYFRNSV